MVNKFDAHFKQELFQFLQLMFHSSAIIYDVDAGHVANI